MIRPLARHCTQLSGSCLDGEARVGRAARLHGGGCSGASESSARLDGQQRLSGSAAYEDQRARADDRCVRMVIVGILLCAHGCAGCYPCAH